MKILHLSYGDFDGGASIASVRVHRGLLARGVDSKMAVIRKMTDDDSIFSPLTGPEQLYQKFITRFSHLLLRMRKAKNPIFHSLNIFPGAIGKYLKNFSPDLVHLHWICNDMLSIRQIAEIPCPVVWTFHDAWPICGAEHHSASANDFRFRDGYVKENRIEEGIDWDQFVWNLKFRYWSGRSFHIVTPSHWLESKVRQSPLFQKSEILTIPNCGPDYSPSMILSMEKARKKWNLPQKPPLLGFCAFCLSDKNKGGAELLELMSRIYQKRPEIEWVSAGTASLPRGPWKVHSLGKLDSNEDCASFYSSLDLLVTTSKIENYPNTLGESLACGTPCAAFAVGGIPEMITSDLRGILAPPYRTDLLAEKILGYLEKPSLKIPLGDDRTIDKYLDLYQRIAVKQR